MHDPTSRVMIDYITDVMDKKPDVPIFQFSLHPKDVEDLHLSITSRLPTNFNRTVKLHVGDDQSGDVLFARRRPTSKKMGKDNYFLPQSTTHTLRFLSLKDAHRQIPIYSLPTSSQLQWRRDDRYGLTTPTMMSTTDQEPFLPFPMCHPLPLIGNNEEGVCGPAPGTPTNENPNAIANFGLCRYRGICADSLHNATKDECITILDHKRGSVFNDNVPVAGRQEDSPSRNARYSRFYHYQMKRGWSCRPWTPLQRTYSGSCKKSRSLRMLWLFGPAIYISALPTGAPRDTGGHQKAEPRGRGRIEAYAREVGPRDLR